MLESAVVGVDHQGLGGSRQSQVGVGPPCEVVPSREGGAGSHHQGGPRLRVEGRDQAGEGAIREKMGDSGAARAGDVQVRYVASGDTVGKDGPPP